MTLTVTQQSVVPFDFGPFHLEHSFRQALYLDGTGIVEARSVRAAAPRARLDGEVLADVEVVSAGDRFNGVYVAGGAYTVRNAVIDFEGDGGDDFVGWGAGITPPGAGTTLVLEEDRVRTHGAIRAGAPGNGVVVQLMDSDDPGPIVVDGAARCQWASAARPRRGPTGRYCSAARCGRAGRGRAETAGCGEFLPELAVQRFLRPGVGGDAVLDEQEVRRRALVCQQPLAPAVSVVEVEGFGRDVQRSCPRWRTPRRRAR
ncbi:hypothetical protein [Streptomyces sp. NPDC003247]|uniref:hypothetical protein n=1 Tax=Streptomyces sp. NPDC003247 TaxID=3364677 RepID=UPI0036D10CA9